jgi:glucose/arabinose dehydrogenase
MPSLTTCIALVPTLALFGAAAAPQGAKPAAPAAAHQDDHDDHPAQQAHLHKLKLQRICPELALRRPIGIAFEPGDDKRMYVIEQPGRILILDPRDREAKEGKVFMDVRERVNSKGNEEGLLSVAFHPEFAKNGTFFVLYTSMDAGKKRHDVLSRFKVDPETKLCNPSSEEILLDVEDPYSNHNGGTILFGSDRMLYLSLGDGGAANDPHGHGQNLGSLLAKILRIDVDHADAGKPYGIPKDNPFVGTPNARPEVWAYGLRNVWRMSFDRKTGELYAADVGQNLYEEVDIVTKGGNYGWNPREGVHAFAGGKPGEFGHEYIDPVVEYSHEEGSVSITGGYVSRSKAHPQIEGVYVYADLVSGHVWGIRCEGGKRVAGPEILAQTKNHLPTSFGESADGTIFMTTFEGSQDTRAKGAIWRVVPED